MLWFFYNILFAVGFTLVLPYYFWRMKRRGGYAAHFWQRLGFYEVTVQNALDRKPRIWVHAVSVGETFIALKLIETLRETFPRHGFVLTVTTSTAHTIARDALSDEDVLLYFPLDFPPVTRRVLKRVRPSMLLLMECELWPNVIRLSASRGVPVAIVNGRVSENSYRGYRRLKLFTRQLLPYLRLFCVQSDGDRDRLADLGAPPERIHVLGTAKYDVASTDGEDAADMRAVLRASGIAQDELVLLGGSTWDGEEAALLDVYKELKRQHPKLALVLVPRHAERREHVIDVIQERGFEAVRRSTLNVKSPRTDVNTPFVFLVDTTGELRGLYACADVIFVGKSMPPQHGGQNVLEPAVYGKPVIVGPNMENFPVVMKDFLAAQAIVQVRDVRDLGRAAAELVQSKEKRGELGSRAARLVENKRGALKATAALLAPLLDRGGP